jgi:hypothetical protein
MAERMADHTGIRDLARLGRLVEHVAQASEDERRRLRIAAYELLHGLVFAQLTRKLEVRRGHQDCAVAVTKLRPDCLDRFHDDMDAVVEDLFRSARKPIHNLEGWVSSRLSAVTIDAHRRRRGRRGALQRPRLPRWLIHELRQDGRLMDLALDMLEWVGVEANAGIHDWPIEVWAGRRLIEGDDVPRQSVIEDIATVLAAMRKRPRWYDKYVERPLSSKAIPVAAGEADGVEPVDPGRAAQQADEADEARRVELAGLAFVLIRRRIDHGEDIESVVIDVISTLFGAGTGAEELGRVAGLENTDDERVSARLADPQVVDRIVTLVLELLR